MRNIVSRWYAIIALGLIAPLLHFLPDVSAALQYDRSAVAAGQFWRLLTCHWPHWSADHLLWSGGTFAVLVLVCRRLYPRQLLPCVLLSAPLVTGAVMFGTDLQTYRGLSGIDTALFTLLAIQILRENLADHRRVPAAAAGVLLLTLTAKIIYESITRGTLFVSADPSIMTPVPLAHFAGAVAGAIIALPPPSDEDARQRRLMAGRAFAAEYS
jgi:rhomboid family GlyGly-CTERM serine protease